jgi:hypothetical protein
MRQKTCDSSHGKVPGWNRQEVTVDECSCGAPRRRFWVWRDANQELHASSFKPTSGAVQCIIAATARDALLPIVESRVPKHDVQDADDPSILWEGRCAALNEAAG